jgi:hypothetical protein
MYFILLSRKKPERTEGMPRFSTSPVKSGCFVYALVSGITPFNRQGFIFYVNLFRLERFNMLRLCTPFRLTPFMLWILFS